MKSNKLMARAMSFEKRQTPEKKVINKLIQRSRAEAMKKRQLVESFN